MKKTPWNPTSSKLEWHSVKALRTTQSVGSHWRSTMTKTHRLGFISNISKHSLEPENICYRCRCVCMLRSLLSGHIDVGSILLLRTLGKLIKGPNWLKPNEWQWLAEVHVYICVCLPLGHSPMRETCKRSEIKIVFLPYICHTFACMHACMNTCMHAHTQQPVCHFNSDIPLRLSLLIDLSHGSLLINQLRIILIHVMESAILNILTHLAHL